MFAIHYSCAWLRCIDGMWYRHKFRAGTTLSSLLSWPTYTTWIHWHHLFHSLNLLLFSQTKAAGHKRNSNRLNLPNDSGICRFTFDHSTRRSALFSYYWFIIIHQYQHINDGDWEQPSASSNPCIYEFVQQGSDARKSAVCSQLKGSFEPHIFSLTSLWYRELVAELVLRILALALVQHTKLPNNIGRILYVRRIF